VVITIEDEGSSLPNKDLDLLFTKFYTKSSADTGLGLFISKKLIEIIGGNISVENRSLDVGIKFIIDIPISYDNPFYGSKDIATINKHILLINDFSKDVTIIKEKIIQLGYTFDYYEDPLDAIDHFLPKKYFLVFLGIDIKGLDGFELFNELKKRDSMIKGYFLTSNKINREAIDEFFSKDILDQFIYKPISSDIIENIIIKEMKG
jgi:two-component system aerobic respiration control sensor histidine kinase ArcB